MFQSKKQTIQDGNAATLISEGTIITGDINSDNDIRIDGMINGNIISTAKIIIGQNGIVNGNIKGAEADLLGKIIGNLKIDGLIKLRGNTSVTGDIYAGSLQMEPTATFNGNCHMGASVVEINAEKNNVVNL